MFVLFDSISFLNSLLSISRFVIAEFLSELG